MYLTILTIGHSTYPLDVFITLLENNGVERVADVRTIPRSRRNPQFNRDFLPVSLSVSGIGYTHLPGLGGFRKPDLDSANRAWKNAGFRGFADYMQTEQFQEQISTLVDLARDQRVVLMCAEALPWRCHRSLISDALVVRGVRVEHIFADGTRKVHVLTEFAHVEGMRITYP